jgi:predicted Zn finger-like uncharacterized protein
MLIRCPECDFAREVPDEKIPPKAQLATCPKCGHKFYFKKAQDEFDLEAETDEQEPAGEEPEKKDSDIWSALESLNDDDFEEDKGRPFPSYESPRSSDTQGAPWEHLDTFGFFPGFFQTIKEVMLSPVQFFNDLAVSGGFNRPLIFYLLVAEIQALAQFMWQMLGVVPQMQGRPETILGIGMVGFGSLMLLVLYPIFLTLVLFIGSGLNHLCLLAVKAGSRGFEGTFRVVAYANAPMVLAVVPGIGPLIGVLWTLVCTFLGFKIVHRTTSARVLLAILLPLIVVMVLSSLIFMAQGLTRF